jgi:signal transduction histidine kinase
MEEINTNDILEILKSRLSQHDQLKLQVEQLEKALHKANQQLSESEEFKSHFISNISNEIVNPFTSVLALAENILSVDKENWKKVVSMVALIHSEVFNLDFQLKNIFTAARIEAGELIPEITLVNIDQLIKEVIDSFRFEAKRKKVKVKYDRENTSVDLTIYFKTDPEKIRIILSNLLSNAIKFSFDEGLIEIIAQKKEKVLCLEVKDEGQGISRTNEQIIFDRFKRIDSGINSINRGHGLGLSVNKALIDFLKGTVEVKSKIGKGSSFKVTLPESEEESSGVATSGNEIFFKEETF